MQFEEPQGAKKVGTVVGYVFSYALFTAILCGILLFLEKLPESWPYMHVIGITAAIAVLGFIVRSVLK